MARRVPCLEKLESLIAYRPHTPIETIVQYVIDDAQERMAESVGSGRHNALYRVAR
jgi:hypothetical protein